MLEGYQSILIALVPIYLFILGGYVFRKVGWLSQTADESLLKLQINFFYPALIFSYIFGNQALKTPSLLVFPPLIGCASILIGFFVSYWLARWMKYRKGKGLRTLAYTTGTYNYGFIAIPLINAVYHDKSLTGTLMVHNAGVDFAIWTVGILLLTGGFDRTFYKRLLNPPILALILGVILNFILPDSSSVSSFTAKGFQALIDTISWAGNCSVPLALILIGASVSDLIGENSLTPDWKIISIGCGTRILLLPALFIAGATLLPLPMELRIVMIIQASMPAGMFPILMAKHYGGTPQVAVQIVMSTTLLSLLTTPLWVTVGQYFVH